MSNKKYGKFTANLSKEILPNKLCVYIIVYYIIHNKGKNTDLTLKAVTILDNITKWFEIT